MKFTSKKHMWLRRFSPLDIINYLDIPIIAIYVPSRSWTTEDVTRY